MTAQSMEMIFFKNQKLYMATEPLQPYLDSLAEKPRFFPNSTACWRGYHGTWEIKDDDRLFLIDLVCYRADLKIGKIWEVGMDFLFQDQKEVFADWFSGEVRIPYGGLLEYVHGGYDSTYEKELHLVFKEGYLVSYNYVNNILEQAKELINTPGIIKPTPQSPFRRLISKIRNKGNLNS